MKLIVKDVDIERFQFSSHHPVAHKRAVVSTLLKRADSHCVSSDDDDDITEYDEYDMTHYQLTMAL